MTRIPYSPLLLGAALLLAAACGPREPAVEPADRVLLGGYVYTVDANRSVAQAIAIRGTDIAFVGSEAAAEAYIGPNTTVHELEGAMVLPGLHDVHLHPLWIAEMDICDLESQPRTLDELVPFLGDCLKRYEIPAGEWLWVDQWNFATGNQPSDRYPTVRAALDAVSTNHPIILSGNDVHHGAVNSAALARARNADGEVVGLSAETLRTTFASYRELVGTDASGEPDGNLNETARDLIEPPTRLELHDYHALMPDIAAVLAESGITSVQEAAAEHEYLEFYAGLEESGGMTFRVHTALFQQFPRSEEALQMLPDTAEKFQRLRERYAGSRYIRAESVKLFADGVIEGNPLGTPPALPNAAVLSPYRQPIFEIDPETQRVDVRGYVDLESVPCREVREDPERYASKAAARAFQAEHGHLPAQCAKSHGVLEHSEAFIHAFVREMEKAGFAVHIHAVGDRAVRVGLDAFEASRAANGDLPYPQSFAHAQLIHPDDQQRIGEMGVYVAFTYAWISPEISYEMSVIPFIDAVKGSANLYDPEHYYMKNVYPARSVRDRGGILVAGSDAPVDTRDPRPFGNIEQAVTRTVGKITLNADERISIHDAIAAYTINGAKFLGHDTRVGSIEPGKVADLVVLDRNLVELAQNGRANEIGETKVKLTIFDGKVVYEAGR
jgi:predicted amidohydrolase YtcJ